MPAFSSQRFKKTTGEIERGISILIFFLNIRDIPATFTFSRPRPYFSPCSQSSLPEVLDFLRSLGSSHTCLGQFNVMEIYVSYLTLVVNNIKGGVLTTRFLFHKLSGCSCSLWRSLWGGVEAMFHSGFSNFRQLGPFRKDIEGKWSLLSSEKKRLRLPIFCIIE